MVVHVLTALFLTFSAIGLDVVRTRKTNDWLTVAGIEFTIAAHFAYMLWRIV